MSLLACGLNHNTAPLTMRERLSFAPEQMVLGLRELIEEGIATEAAILSTCNRTEFYCSAASQENIIDYLSHRRDIPQSALQKHFYNHHENDAIKHMLRVASGLDSMLLGEPQVLGQMKQAFALAHSAGTLGPELGRLAQYIYATSKKVRHESKLGTGSVSIAYISVMLAKRLFEDIKKATVLLIGAGDTIELVSKYLQESGVTQFIIANRSHPKAAALADKCQGEPIQLSDIGKHLYRADIVITATASPIPILGKGAIERAIKLRKRNPMFMVDLSVPRDIEEQVSTLEDVYLYTIDDLQHVIKTNLREQRDAALIAEDIVNLHTSHYLCWQRSLSAVPLIKEYRANCERLREAELQKAKIALEEGKDPAEIIETLSYNITNKLMHRPTTSIRQAGYDSDLTALEYVKDFLGLDE